MVHEPKCISSVLDLEAVCDCSLVNFLDALSQPTLCCAHVFRSGADTEVTNIQIETNSRIQEFGDNVDF